MCSFGLSIASGFAIAFGFHEVNSLETALMSASSRASISWTGTTMQQYRAKRKGWTIARSTFARFCGIGAVGVVADDKPRAAFGGRQRLQVEFPLREQAASFPAILDPNAERKVVGELPDDDLQGLDIGVILAEDAIHGSILLDQSQEV